MKRKTSVTLSEDLLAAFDRTQSNRSLFLEAAAHGYLAELARQHRDANDLASIDAHADQLNEEALDVLQFQDLL